MDIHRWLHDTADREPPDEQQHAVPDHIQTYAGDTEEKPGVGRYRRKRKRASSDGSLIEYSRRERTNEIRYARPTEHVRDTTPSTTRHRSQDRSRSDESPPRERQHKSYERRPRHKTKADRYEPKKKRQHEYSAREKPASKRRESHRSADGGRSAGVVQSFQLKNGPKNQRLTLKPDAAVGLFRHGRASAQMPPGGAGLPDLVFNEMRFLQKPKDHQDKPAARPENETTTKKDRQQRREEEISAYFTADREVTRNDRLSRRNSRNSPQEEEVDQPRRRTPARPPPVDLPEKPFLGFGSKGQHATTQEPTTNSYYTWSESEAPHGPKDIPARRQNQAFQLKPVRRYTEPTEAHTPQFRVPRRSTTKTRLPSVPHTMPSEPPIHVSLSADEEPLPREPSTFHTSDILRVHRGITDEVAEENQEPASSTPTSKLLRKAFEAVHRPVAEESSFNRQPRKGRQKSASTLDPVLTPALRKRRLESASTLQPTRSKVVSSSTARRPQPVQVYDEMLDDPQRLPYSVTPVHIYANARQAEALAYSPIVQQPSDTYGLYQEVIHEPTVSYEEPTPLSVPSQQLSELYAQPQEDFRPVLGRHNTVGHDANARDEGLTGFWRPNRLY